MRAGEVEKANCVFNQHSFVTPLLNRFNDRIRTGPAEVVGVKVGAGKGTDSQVLASSEADRRRLDEDGVFGPGGRSAAAVVVEAGVDAGDAAVLALGFLLDGGGADGQDGSNESGDSGELHFCG